MTAPALTDVASELDARLAGCMIVDRHRLRSALRRIVQSHREPGGPSTELDRLSVAIAASEARHAQRLARLPVPTFPESLPVSSMRGSIGDAIAKHPVTIVCGETGSGKTTQLPKICLALGRGVAGLIGHTQPRRIAARTVAARIAHELGTPPGDVVGYKVRFQDQTRADAYIKLMTDGILLAETQSDRHLSAYDTLIVDEAHERSLNIDFLLGYLRGLLDKRPELKLIVTSATIDAERFARHFGGAPVIEVSGRVFPVEVRYRAPAGEADDDGDADDDRLAASILDAVDEAQRCGPGDILVFLPGEREIREAAEALRKHHPPGTEILPLYARLSFAEQARVFEPSGQRRIVLATNVAETSLTVPGIRYVIDPGIARINRYSYRNKVEQLLVEKISQASARQRAGRCGRVMNGVCFRLYAEADFEARAPYTDPELLRSSLAGVILRMKSLGIGEVESFPFIDPPLPRMINDGYQLLAELGAVDETRRLTPIGRELARLPIDPRIGRMVLEGKRLDCLSEVLVIAAALAVQDPRERPLERAQAADDRHAAFRDEQSDFVGLLKLWRFFQDLVRHKKSNRKLAQTLHDHFLSPLRMREWHEVHTQLHALVTEAGGRLNDKDASYEALHQALLTGLLGNVGMKNEEGDYNGARAIRFAIHPSSGVRKRQPRWLMAAELVETSRLFARTLARIEPEWVERVAGHVVKRAWFEPRWDKDRAEVIAWEQVSLYGLVLVARRRARYAPIDAQHARDIFIRSGLVGGGYISRGAFQAHNTALRKELEALEHKTRRHDVLVDEAALFRFFDERLPAEVNSGATFEAWRRQAEAATPRCLFMAREDLMRRGTDDAARLYPDALTVGGVTVSLRYRFDPGHPLDGVTALVPLHLLNRLTPEPFEWLVPGLLRDKLNAMIRALPKHLRRSCVPLPETVTECLIALDAADHDVGLDAALARALKVVRSIDVPPAIWRDLDLAPHLQMNFQVIDEQGGEIANGRDLGALQIAHGAAAQTQFAADARWERSGLRSWDDIELAEEVRFKRGKEQRVGYPALIDDGDSVRVTLLDTQFAAEAATRAGVCRLVRFVLRDQLRALDRQLNPNKTLALCYLPFGGGDALKEALIQASVQRAVWADPQPIRTRAQFEARLKDARARLQIVGQEYARLAETILVEAQALRRRLEGGVAQAFRHAAQDMQRQLDALIFAGFIAQVPYERLQHYPRYLAAIERRLQKLPELADRDEHHTRELERWRQQIEARAARNRKSGCNEPALDDLRWMLEEQRVSLFAQELKTAYPISYKRLEKAWAALR